MNQQKPIMLPPLDPETILLVGLFGLVSTIALFVSFKAAEAIGPQVTLLPRLPPPKVER